MKRELLTKFLQTYIFIANNNLGKVFRLHSPMHAVWYPEPPMFVILAGKVCFVKNFGVPQNV